MDCDYTGPGGTPLERIAQQQGGTHPAPCARSCEANAYEIEVRRLNAELERERMRLAACGVVALADTPESAAQAREMRDEYRSASCDDVARRVDECMTMRAECDAMAAELAELEGQEPVAWMGFGPRDGHPEFSINKPAGSVMRDFNMRPVFVRPVPAKPVNARLLYALKRAKGTLVAFKFIPGEANRWEESDEEALVAIDSAVAEAEAQQERLLQDMHDAGREVDRVMAEPQPDADGPWKSAVIDQLVIAHILTAEHESDPPLKAIQDLLAYHADIAVDPRVSGAAAKLVEQAKAEEREACAHKGWMAASWDCEDRVKAAILARGQK